MRKLLVSLSDPGDAAAILSPGLVRDLASGQVGMIVACTPGAALDHPRIASAAAEAGVAVEALPFAPPGLGAQALEVLERVAARAVGLFAALEVPELGRLNPSKLADRWSLDHRIGEMRERRLAAETWPEAEALFDRVAPDLVLSTRPFAAEERGLIAAAARRRIRVVGVVRASSRLPGRPVPAVRLDRVAVADARLARALVVHHGYHASELVVLDAPPGNGRLPPSAEKALLTLLYASLLSRGSARRASGPTGGGRAGPG